MPLENTSLMSLEDSVFREQFICEPSTRLRIWRVTNFEEASDDLLRLVANDNRRGGPDIGHC